MTLLLNGKHNARSVRVNREKGTLYTSVKRRYTLVRSRIWRLRTLVADIDLSIDKNLTTIFCDECETAAQRSE